MDPLIENGQPTDDEILASTQNPNASPAATPVPAPSEATFDPTQFGYNFRQQTVYPKDKSEMIELLQLGHSFRTNKPKWEQDRQAYSAYEAKKDTYRKYDELSAALQANPTFRTELEQLATKYSGQAAQPQQPQNPASTVPPEILETVNSLKQWKEQQETQASDNELKRELDDIERANTSYDWKTDSGEGNLRSQLLKFMHEKRVYDPEIALSAMMYKTDLQKARFEAERKASDDAAKARKAGVVAPGTQPAPQAPAGGLNHRNMSYDELENAALASLGR